MARTKGARDKKSRKKRNTNNSQASIKRVNANNSSISIKRVKV